MRQPAYFPYPLSTVAPRDLLLFQCIELHPGDSVLEIGTGSGSSMFRIAGSVRTIHGVDISSGSIERVRRGLAARKIPSDEADAFALDFCEVDAALRLPTRYDTVFSCDTLEHVRSPDNFLANIFKALKRGGRALITFPNEREDRCHGMTHFKTFQSLTDTLWNAGFSPEDTQISTCSLSAGASATLKSAWLRPRRFIERAIRGFARHHDSPQVFDQTDFHRTAPILEPVSPIINAYCWGVMRLMSAGKPAYELSPVGSSIADEQILIQAYKRAEDGA